MLTQLYLHQFAKHLDTCLAAFLQLKEHDFGTSGFLIGPSV